MDKRIPLKINGKLYFVHSRDLVKSGKNQSELVPIQPQDESTPPVKISRARIQANLAALKAKRAKQESRVRLSNDSRRVLAMWILGICCFATFFIATWLTLGWIIN